MKGHTCLLEGWREGIRITRRDLKMKEASKEGEITQSKNSKHGGGGGFFEVPQTHS